MANGRLTGFRGVEMGVGGKANGRLTGFWGVEMGADE